MHFLFIKCIRALRIQNRLTHLCVLKQDALLSSMRSYHIVTPTKMHTGIKNVACAVQGQRDVSRLLLGYVGI
jgi:hypothetical protein